MTAKKHDSYKIVRFEWVPACELTEHPAARMPMAEDDRHSIDRSIAEQGAVFLPLLVIDHEDPEKAAPIKYRIVDGINRWKASRDADPNAVLPCLVIECDDPAKVVAVCLSVGRKRSTGTRIMSYLEGHKKEVLAAWAVNSAKGENFRESSKVSRETLDSKGLDFWSAAGISERLEVCKEDVLCGIELLYCQEEKLTLENPMTIKRAPADGEYLAALQEIRDRVICGASPIRTWRAAMFGKVGNGGQGRANARYDVTAHKSLVSLRNAFEHWQKIPHKARPRIIGLWHEVLEKLPNDLR